MSEAPTQPSPWTVLATGHAVHVDRPVNRRQLMLRILGLALVVAAVVTVGAGIVMRQLDLASAEGDAAQVARVFALDVAQPALRDGVATGNAVDLAGLESLVRNRMVPGNILRVRLWRADGKIVYSDDRRLIGRTFPLLAADLKTINTGGIEYGAADLSAPDNLYLRGHSPPLEVDVGVHTPNGTRMMITVDFDYGVVRARADALWVRFAAVAVGSVLLLLAGLLPLIRRLIRSLDRGHTQRQVLLQRAIDASDAERRRVAALLHDGPVQELVGASYFIGAASIRTHDTDAGRILEEAERTVQATVASLRALLLDVYPPALGELGLAAALDSLAEGARSRGATVKIEVKGGLKLTTQTEMLVFRVARETLANAVKHGEGNSVTVKVRQERSRTVLTVADDGPGFDAKTLIAHPRAGHFGLRMLRDAVTEAGLDTSLTVKSARGSGTTWRLTVLS